MQTNLSHKPTISWTSETLHVDLDTGEQLTKWQVRTTQNYLYQKTFKHGSVNKGQPIRQFDINYGQITYVRGYVRNPQTQLFDTAETL